MSEGMFCYIEFYIFLTQVKLLTKNYDQILHKSTWTKNYDHFQDLLYLHQRIKVNILHKSIINKFFALHFSAQKWVMHLLSFCTNILSCQFPISASFLFFHFYFEIIRLKFFLT